MAMRVGLGARIFFASAGIVTLVRGEVLWGIAPHIIHPLRFVLPVTQGMRPAWMLRAGLFLYDHIGGQRSLPGACSTEWWPAPVAPAGRTSPIPSRHTAP